MDLVVCKFGGTSLANVDNIKRVCEIVKSDPRRRIVIVSAPGKRSKEDIKITDILIDINNKKNAGEDYSASYAEFEKRFLEIELQFGLETDLREILDEFLSEIPDGNSDFIVSTGEYFMAKMMAEILGYTFLNLDKIPAIRFDADGNVDLVESAKYFDAHRGQKLVIPGFYGITEAGAVKTFSRGGSDITGAIIANIADAVLYENWTDVDGVYDRDPNKYSDAKKFDVISFSQVEELARNGANVLHPDCIKFCSDKNIPINLKNTFNPSNPGTVIR
jgi:aspartate kinase